MKKLVSQKELKLIQQMHQKNVCFVIIGTLKMLHLNLRFLNRLFKQLNNVRLEEQILETFILVLLESGIKNHGKNLIS